MSEQARRIIAVSILNMSQAILSTLRDGDEDLFNELEEIYKKIHEYVEHGVYFDVAELMEKLAKVVREATNRGLI